MSELPLHTAQSPREVLDLMEELYKDERRWTKEDFARDEHGFEAGIADRNACSFCLGGAILRFAAKPEVESITHGMLLASAINNSDDSLSLSDFNDSPSTTIDDIRRVISEAKKRV